MEQTPWINEEKIRVGQIGPEEQRRAIDAQLARLLASIGLFAACVGR